MMQEYLDLHWVGPVQICTPNNTPLHHYRILIGNSRNTRDAPLLCKNQRASTTLLQYPY